MPWQTGCSCRNKNGCSNCWGDETVGLPRKLASEPDKKYIVLQSKATGARFFSHITSDGYRSDWYEEVGCFNTAYECQECIGISEWARVDDKSV